MADLTKLEIIVEQGKADLLTAALAMNAPYGWEEETLPTGEVLCRLHSETPAFCQELRSTVLSLFPEASLRLSKVQQVDWLEAWKDFFTPVEGGRRFLVLAPWMETEKRAAQESGRHPLIIEPKMAFGTGHHASTALCLKAISDLADEGKLKPGMRFLDLGTGSGILGIACCMLGLSGLGLDLDILAVENAEENRAINGIEGKDFMVRLGSLDQADTGGYDFVIANILAEPLRDMAPRLAALVRPGGCLTLSGILNTQAEGVEAAYRAQGFPAARRDESGEWCAIVWS